AYTALEICDGYDLAHVPHPFILQCPGNRQKNWDQTSKALCSKSLLDLIPTITPVLVATATTTGLSLRRCALAAMVTAVSVMPQASFPMVFPVQGAITSTSSSFFGPMGSASLTLPITVCPVISSTAELNSSAVPERGLVCRQIAETMGCTVSYSSHSFSSSRSTFPWVQKEPHSANPTRSFLKWAHLVLPICGRRRPG